MSLTLSSSLGLVPHRRLGSLLAERRNLYGYSVADMSRASAGRFSETELDAIERGLVPLDDVTIEALSLLYEFNSAPPTQQRSRLVISDEEDVPADIVGTTFTDEQAVLLLRRFVALLYLLRGKAVGEVLPLRGDDTQVISAALERDEASVILAINRIMAEDAVAVGELADRMRHRLVVPAAGLVVGPTPAGMLLLVK